MIEHYHKIKTKRNLFPCIFFLLFKQESAGRPALKICRALDLLENLDLFIPED